ncbi:MAG: transcriptional regulator, MarR family [Neobacillus sp.]|jgi:DNA-binding MarR family transcriptional regulator|nr:transcriptional regulator, MarR family [Neobacillus sp.]
MPQEEVIVKAINIISESMRESMRRYKENTQNSKELFNLSITQLHYLHVIRERTNTTITEIAEIFGVQKSTVTVTVNKLLQCGFIEKITSKSDLRVVYVSLTEKGKEVIELEDQGYRQFAAYILAMLDEEEQSTFTFLLNKVTNNITRS